MILELQIFVNTTDFPKKKFASLFLAELALEFYHFEAIQKLLSYIIYYKVNSKKTIRRKIHKAFFFI